VVGRVVGDWAKQFKIKNLKFKIKKDKREKREIRFLYFGVMVKKKIGLQKY